MMASTRPSNQVLDRLLVRCIYQAVVQAIDGEIHFDGGVVTSLTRDNALDLMRECNVLKVFAINLIEGTASDITDELEGELEYEREQAIVQGETYLPLNFERCTYGDNAGRTL